MSDRLAADVAVVGAGPAGLAAAAHAAEAGRRVVLVDASPRAGGQIWRHHDAPPPAARPWLDRLARARVARVAGAVVVDAPSAGELLLAQDDRAVHVTHRSLVLATGARERLLPFPGWTLPGAIGAGAAQALRESGARFDGLRVVVAGSGPLLVAVAAALRRAGARVVGVAEQAPLSRLAAFGASLVRHPAKLAEALSHGMALRGTPYRTGSWVREAVGRDRVERALVTDGRREWAWECDVLACGYGLVPNLELPRLVGCATDGERVTTDDRQRTTVESVLAAGELCGIGGAGHAIATGSIAGLVAAGAAVPDALLARRRREQAFAAALARAFALRDELRHLARPDTVVCRCEDVPLAPLLALTAAREAKLHTRAGMGPCQGRVCGGALAFLFGWGADSVRPPLAPVPLSLLSDVDAPASRTAPQEDR